MATYAEQAVQGAPQDDWQDESHETQLLAALIWPGLPPKTCWKLRVLETDVFESLRQSRKLLKFFDCLIRITSLIETAR
jgi:hypothetical protein